MNTHDLVVGLASAEITPSPGIHMGGYWGRQSGATGVHDPLMAKALSFALSESRSALVSLDLVGLDAITVAELRQGIGQKTGIPASGIMICCSHTHAGPLTVPFRGMGEVDRDYFEWMKERIIQTAAQAAAQAQPVQLAYARIPVQIGVNRRQGGQPDKMVIGQNPRGPVVPYAHAIRFDGRGGLLAVLFSHPCHGVVLGRENYLFSADFPGAAARCIEARTGAAALFVNGACGDINPRKTGGSFGEVEELGEELGQAVVVGLGSARPLVVEAVRGLSETVQLPLRDLPPRLSIEIEKLALQLKAQLKKIAGSGGDVWAQRVPQAQLDWAEQMLERVREGKVGERHQPFEIQVIGLGELALVGMEGEIFGQYQLELEAESPWPATVLCGYANGCIGYVPTADEYERGGYEVEEAYKVYPSVQMIAPQSETLIRQTVKTLLARLAGC